MQVTFSRRYGANLVFPPWAGHLPWARPRNKGSAASEGSGDDRHGPRYGVRCGRGRRASFPDVPRLELDELLVQPMDRAGDVLAAQDGCAGCCAPMP